MVFVICVASACRGLPLGTKSGCHRFTSRRYASLMESDVAESGTPSTRYARFHSSSCVSLTAICASTHRVSSARILRVKLCRNNLHSLLATCSKEPLGLSLRRTFPVHPFNSKGRYACDLRNGSPPLSSRFPFAHLFQPGRKKKAPRSPWRPRPRRLS